MALSGGGGEIVTKMSAWDWENRVCLQICQGEKFGIYSLLPRVEQRIKSSCCVAPVIFLKFWELDLTCGLAL